MLDPTELTPASAQVILCQDCLKAQSRPYYAKLNAGTCTQCGQEATARFPVYLMPAPETTK